jgi:hypothetical protein
LSRSNGLSKDRRAKDEEQDNDYEEGNYYDYDNDFEANVDNENLVAVSKIAHCIKYPEALIGFPHPFHENVRILPRFSSRKP